MSALVSHKIQLAQRLPPVLGVGAYLKNTLCLIQGDEAWISRENGSLDSVEAITRFQETAQALIAAAGEKPVLIAHDWHPDFPSTRWALDYVSSLSFRGTRSVNPESHLVSAVTNKWDPRFRGDDNKVLCIGIQHHHAHAAAVMAEHGIAHPILALTLDGFGLGENNEAWGGELLRVDAGGFTRLGHLLPLPQPGGDVAARQPWRMGAAALFALGRGGEIAARYAAQGGAAQVALMMERGLNAPLTSSAGRLFDAACGLLNVMPVATFEGEAPMKLESLVTASTVMEGGWRIGSELKSPSPCGLDAEGRQGQRLVEVFANEVSKNFGEGSWQCTDLSNPSPKNHSPAGSDFSTLPQGEGDCFVLDLRPLLARLLDLDAGQGANLFHGTLSAALLEWLQKAVQGTGIKQVALCGGCFLNKVLRESLTKGMIEANLTPLLPKALPVSDPAIALGQAYAAALTIGE